MYIAAIHHSHDFSNDYAAYISKLLDDTAVENGYDVKDYHHHQLTKDPLPKENLLLHIVIPASSIFSSMDRAPPVFCNKPMANCLINNMFC